MAEQPDGHVPWGNWAFDYAVAGRQGLSLANGYFRGRRIFNKLSLPVIRVKYVNDEQFFGATSRLGTGCGPYNDQITWDPINFGEDLNPISGPHHLMPMTSDGKYILNEETELEGSQATWLELAVYARIGAYHIKQAWYLNQYGMILPRVFSKGLSCNLDHWHHPYWRFDFDLDGPANQQVNVFGSNGSEFLGVVTKEGRLLDDPAGGTRYNVENKQTGLKAWVLPRPLDATTGTVGPTPPFCSVDGYVRKFRQEEDVEWPHRPEHEIGFDVHELCSDADDIVLWNVAHLHHHAHEGADHWHEAGPDIWVEVPPAPEPLPESRRAIDVSGRIDIKDFKAFEADVWGHFNFHEMALVEPFSPHGEVFVRKGVVGDMTANLIVRIDLQPDNAVAVSVVGELYDEQERVARAEGNFHVAAGATHAGARIHLVDHHVLDPDTADMVFDVKNDQAPPGGLPLRPP
ncbi:hypothetical protein ACFPH6_08805 [Streptomyces xiangluensis]|uniref:Uncharacterized protein n=1 Tax=Streptomyces xiangluensis TaxID=2665720 RepID=A0ABV8YKP1_9ACTN